MRRWNTQPANEKRDQIAIQRVLEGGGVPSTEMAIMMEQPSEQRARIHRVVGVNSETPGGSGPGEKSDRPCAERGPYTL